MDYDIFREELAAKYPAYGHALWEPNTGGHYAAVEIGDVGFVRDGYFHRLFNVLLPEDHPSHQDGVPQRHEPLVLRTRSPTSTGTLHPNNLRSNGVLDKSDESRRWAAGPDEAAQLSFSCSRRRGAILSLPVPAQRKDTAARGVFAKCITKHINEWFAFTQERGLGISREDIILVTGCHLTRTWATIAFQEREEQLSFGVQVSGHSDVTWQFTPEGAQGVAYNLGPSGQNLPENQCIFIRGFRVILFSKILPLLRGAAGPAQLPGEDDPDPDPQLNSIPAETRYQDPLHTLMEYIATQTPDCDMALVHDDDLRCIENASLESLRPDIMMSYLRKSAPEIWHLPCGEDWSTSSHSDMSASKAGAPPSKAVTKVATLSKHAFGVPEDYLTLDEDIPQAAYTSTSTRHEAVWDQGSNVTASGALGVPTTSASTPEDKLEDLRRIGIAIENSSGLSRTSAATMGEGNYTGLPLERFLDLIRPRPVPGMGAESGAGADGQRVPDVSTESAIPNVRPRSSYASEHQRTTQSDSGAGGSVSLSGQIEAAQPVGTYPQGTSGYPPGKHQLVLSSEREHVSTFAASMQPAQRNTKQIPESESERRRRLLRESYRITQGLLQTYQAQVAQELQGDDRARILDAQRVRPEHTHEYGHQHAPPQEPLRPLSPHFPLIAWDPAAESPTATAPVSNFPDWSPTQYRSDSSRVASPIQGIPASFAVSPPSRLPEPLLQEEHYVNVLGEHRQGETQSPDRATIQPVFPWEDKPRSTPGRVLLPAVQPSPSPPLRYSPMHPSPPSGFSPSSSDSNAWDSVPSIASRLVRPSQYKPPPSSAFGFHESRRREKALFRNAYEFGEIDMDEEDAGDEGGQSPPGKQRPRSGLSSGKSKERYLSQGKETLDQDKNQMSPRSREVSSGVSPALASRQQVSLPSLSSSSETASSASSVARSIWSTDPRLVHRAVRPANPENGFEILEKKSEEVLTRFLGMGSWEEEEAQPPT